MPPAPRVLVVDAAGGSRAAAESVLAGAGFEVVEACSGREALQRARSADVVVLDADLPDDDPLAVIERIRAAAQRPVLLASERVPVLDPGADDYVRKPFAAEQLVARVRAALWRAGDERALARLDFHGLALDLTTRELEVAGRLVAVPPKEFDLLACLASEPSRVFGRDELLRFVWQSSAEWQDPATVTEHVRRLRRRIEADPARPRWVLTVRGLGYRFGG